MHGALDEREILRAVVAGIRDASESTGIEIHPIEIVYVENDSPRYSLYRYCAYLIAQRVMSGEPFSRDVV
jgi:hypothetical protein